MKRDDLKGLWISLAIHLGLLVIALVGFEFASPKSHQEIIPVVQAVAIDNRTENRKRLQEQKDEQLRQQREADKRREEQEKAEQARLDEEKAKEKQKQEQIKKAAEAKALKEKQAAEKKRKELEAKKLAEAKKKAAEQRRKEEAEQLKRQQEEELKQLAEEARQEKLRAEQAAKEAEARARQIDIDRAAYQREIARFMTQHWIKPPNTKSGDSCDVKIVQSRSGHVLDVTVVACIGNAAFRDSVERAANKPDRLPLPRNPEVFERNIRISFEEK